MRCLVLSMVVGCCGLPVLGQQAAAVNPEPAALSDEAILLDESVVASQWAKTLPAVHAQWLVRVLSPGQCVRVGVVSKGEGSSEVFKDTQVGFTVHFAEHDVVVPMTAAVGFKKILPGAVATLAASGERWCVPADAAAGEVKIDAVVANAGKKTPLKSMTVTVVSPEMPGAPPFDDKNITDWMQTYYRHPRPEFLIPVVSLIFQNAGQTNGLQQFVISAMRRDPAVVARLGGRLAKENPQVQAMMVKLAKEAGVEMKIPFELSAMQKEFVQKLPDVPDAFHPAENEHIGEAQDMLWCMFMATGERAPVDKIISMLAWRADYDAFMKMRAEKKQITEVTPSIAHAVAYSAAGWSLSSFQRSDPLVADYIAATLADAGTPEEIRKELRGMGENPAFKRE